MARKAASASAVINAVFFFFLSFKHRATQNDQTKCQTDAATLRGQTDPWQTTEVLMAFGLAVVLLVVVVLRALLGEGENFAKGHEKLRICESAIAWSSRNTTKTLCQLQQKQQQPAAVAAIN
ncbi:unnamed protein product [Ceratitis capitata]|uniref:(Mediterranean fruit fly) hypothetical protein n=1 Tax=Ceratitis capitata TaxID=7213 RepID=A0A811V766_CERCA|nr:unnamed protein product [Ceratitis capitata]